MDADITAREASDRISPPKPERHTLKEVLLLGFLQWSVYIFNQPTVDTRPSR